MYQRSYSKANNYKYNQGVTGNTFQGKEGKFFRTERESELGWDMTKFRMYDYALGRFLNVDPLADIDVNYRWSTYSYSFNNPIRWNDPYGDCPTCPESAVEGFKALGKMIKRDLGKMLQAAEDYLITDNQVDEVAKSPEKTELSGKSMVGKMNGDGPAIEGYGTGIEMDVSAMQNLLGVSMSGGSPEALGERISTAVSGAEKTVERVGYAVDGAKKLKARFVKDGDNTKFLDSVPTSVNTKDTLIYQELQNTNGNVWNAKGVDFEDY